MMEEWRNGQNTLYLWIKGGGGLILFKKKKINNFF